MPPGNPVQTDLPALYKRNDICLWVEDPLTRYYLETLWSNDLNLGLLVAGGHEGTRAVAEMAYRDRIHHVFGLVDRDFGNTNRQHWASPPMDLRCYRTEVHEVENFLLDPDALAASEYNSRARTSDDILSHLQQTASKLVWWMACRQTLAELRKSVTDAFPIAPPIRPEVNSTTALQHILGSSWYTTRSDMVSDWDESRVRGTLNSHYDTFKGALDRGDWKRCFSGKEIFISICDFISTIGIEKTLREEVAKDVAAFQRKHTTVPAELMELRDSLYKRVLRRSAPPLNEFR